MWAFIMLALLVLSIVAIIFLASRIGKFDFIKKITKDKGKLGTLLGLVIMVVITTILWLLWGFMNAVVCILHLFVFWLVIDGIFALIRRIGNKEFTRYYAGGIAIVFSVCYLGAGWYYGHHVYETRYEINTEKAVGKLKIAVLSDSHVGATFDGEGFARHMNIIEKKQPDIVLIVGDFVDDDTSKADMVRACKALGEMKTTYGVYYVLGNHDNGYYSPEHRGYSGEELLRELENNNVHVMLDDVELIDNRFYLIGRADKSAEYGEGRKSMEELVKEIDPDKFSIVLDHQPQDYQAQSVAGVDLVFSGHTHGGQLFPLMNVENLTKITPDDRVYGMERRGNTDFIVTSGIADWTIKFKTGCISEYLLVEIQERHSEKELEE